MSSDEEEDQTSTADHDDDAGYNDTHRVLLQVFMTQSPLTFTSAAPILAEILSIRERRAIPAADITPADFTSYITTINAHLREFDYEIRCAAPQQPPPSSSSSRNPRDNANSTDTQLIYALVNVTSDPFTQPATPFSPDELAFVKRLLDAMFDTNNHPARDAEVCAVTEVQAMALRKAPTNSSRTQDEEAANTQGNNNAAAAGNIKDLTHQQADDVLRNLVDQAWFVRSDAGYYSLSDRALMELAAWLVEVYNDPPEHDDDDDEDEGDVWQRIKMCEACRGIVTIGQRCASLQCTCRLHAACVARFFHGRNNPTNGNRNSTTAADARLCPKCGTPWTGRDMVGELADRRRRTSSSNNHSIHNDAASRRRSSTTTTTTMNGTQGRKRGRPPGSKNSSSIGVVKRERLRADFSDDDVDEDEDVDEDMLNHLDQEQEQNDDDDEDEEDSDERMRDVRNGGHRRRRPQQRNRHVQSASTSRSRRSTTRIEIKRDEDDDDEDEDSEGLY